MSNINLVITLQIMQEKTQFFFSEMPCLQQQQRVNLYPTRVGISILAHAL
jgi:hypothetical protein